MMNAIVVEDRALEKISLIVQLRKLLGKNKGKILIDDGDDDDDDDNDKRRI